MIMRKENKVFTKDELMTIKSRYKSLSILKQKFNIFKPAISSLYSFYEYIYPSRVVNDSNSNGNLTEHPKIADIQSFETILNKIVSLINILFIPKQASHVYMHLKDKNEEYIKQSKHIQHQIALCAQKSLNKYNNIYQTKKLSNEMTSIDNIGKGKIYIEILPLIITDYLELNDDINIIDLDKDKSASIILRVNKEMKTESNRCLKQFDNKLLQVTHSINLFRNFNSKLDNENYKKSEMSDNHFISVYNKQNSIKAPLSYLHTQSLTESNNQSRKESFRLHNNNYKQDKLSFKELKEACLAEIYLFYLYQQNPGRKIQFDSKQLQERGLGLSEFSRFCVDFNIDISKESIVELFKKNTLMTNNQYMTLVDFKAVFDKMGIIANTKNLVTKRKKIKKMKEHQLSLNEKQFKIKSNFDMNDIANNFNSHRVPDTKALEIFYLKRSKLNEEIYQLESDAILMSQLTINHIQEWFTSFIGIDYDYSFRNKLKGYKTNALSPSRNVIINNANGIYNDRYPTLVSNSSFKNVISLNPLNQRLCYSNNNRNMNDMKENVKRKFNNGNRNINIKDLLEKRVMSSFTQKHLVNTQPENVNQEINIKKAINKKIDDINKPVNNNDYKNSQHFENKSIEGYMKDNSIDQSKSDLKTDTDNKTINDHKPFMTENQLNQNKDNKIKLKPITQCLNNKSIFTEKTINSNTKSNNQKLLFTSDNQLYTLKQLKKNSYYKSKKINKTQSISNEINSYHT